jgi:hypothetical protein
MLVFLAMNSTYMTVLTCQTDCYATTDQFYTPTYMNRMKQNLHILYLFNFIDKKNEVDGTGKHSDTLLKICIVLKNIFKILQPFWTSSSTWSHCPLQRNVFPNNTNITAHKYTNYTTPLVIFIMWKYLGKAIQHMTQSQNWPVCRIC